MANSRQFYLSKGQALPFCESKLINEKVNSLKQGIQDYNTVMLPDDHPENRVGSRKFPTPNSTRT